MIHLSGMAKHSRFFVLYTLLILFAVNFSFCTSKTINIVDVNEKQTLKKAKKIQNNKFNIYDNAFYVMDGFTETIVSWSYRDTMFLEYAIFKSGKMMKGAIIESEFFHDEIILDTLSYKDLMLDLEEMGYVLSRVHFSCMIKGYENENYRIDWGIDYDQFESFKFQSPLMQKVQKDYIKIKNQYFIEQ